MTFRAIDPTTGTEVGTHPETADAELEVLLARAADAAVAWRGTTIDERTRHLRALAAGLRAGAADHATLMAREMGKPVVDGEAEIEKCAVTCEYFAAEGARMLAPEERHVDARRAYVRLDPLGTVLAVMPWNYPFWQLFRAAVPALVAGNTIVLKHAQNVPGCAEAIQALAERAGLPRGVVTNVRIAVERVAALIADPRIHAVTLTGSTRAGAAVATAAGRALKKSVLELGGSDAFVVLDDADLDAAARVAADARLVNAGQSCIAAKRFVVVASVADAFVERFVAAMRARVVGNPLERTTQMGPLARHAFRDEVHRQTTASIAQGARALLGGAVPDGPGAFYPSTVLVGVAPGMPAFDEEVFGPVAAVVRARDEADAIRLANASRFGLGASVWTRDDARAAGVAAALEAGAICINGQVRSDPRLPFGGVKDSGYGRELSEYGIREFVNVKAVVVR
jgi:succinate-semialdehyde dehydrogenase/glutarate-semialdehyde dehydrogenase